MSSKALHQATTRRIGDLCLHATILLDACTPHCDALPAGAELVIASMGTRVAESGRAEAVS